MTSEAGLFALLGACISVDRVRADDRLARQLSSSSIVQPLLALAEREHVAPALLAHLRASGLTECLPAEDRRKLDLRYRYNLLRNERLRSQVLDITAILNGSGIDACVLKGGAVLFDDYIADPGARVMADIDLLVRPESYRRAVALCRERGFAVLDPHYEWTFSSNPLQRRSDIAPVEIHHLVGEQRRILPPDLAWKRAEPVVGTDAGLFLLSPTHRVLHNILHSELQDGGHAQRIVRLRQLYDLANLQRRYADSIDWGWIAATMKRFGLERMLTGRLALAARYLGMARPAAVPGDGRRHVVRCMRALRFPLYRRLLSVRGALAAPFAAPHLDLVYGCGLRGSALLRCRVRHGAHLMSKHRLRAFGKVAVARRRFQ